MASQGMDISGIVKALLSGHTYFDYNVCHSNGKALGCYLSIDPDLRADGYAGWSGTFFNQRNGQSFGALRSVKDTDTLSEMVEAAAKMILASAKRVKGHVTIRLETPAQRGLNLHGCTPDQKLTLAGSYQDCTARLIELAQDSSISAELREAYLRHARTMRSWARTCQGLE